MSDDEDLIKRTAARDALLEAADEIDSNPFCICGDDENEYSFVKWLRRRADELTDAAQ